MSFPSISYTLLIIPTVQRTLKLKPVPLKRLTSIGLGLFRYMQVLVRVPVIGLKQTSNSHKGQILRKLFDLNGVLTYLSTFVSLYLLILHSIERYVVIKNPLLDTSKLRTYRFRDCKYYYRGFYLVKINFGTEINGRFILMI